LTRSAQGGKKQRMRKNLIQSKTTPKIAGGASPTLVPDERKAGPNRSGEGFPKKVKRTGGSRRLPDARDGGKNHMAGESCPEKDEGDPA